MAENYDLTKEGERRHCMNHEGHEEKIKGLQGQISSRLNLQTWLLGIIIVIVTTGMAYLSGALNNHDKSITRLEDRLGTATEDIKGIKAHYDVIEKRVDDIGRAK